MSPHEHRASSVTARGVVDDGNNNNNANDIAMDKLAPRHHESNGHHANNNVDIAAKNDNFEQPSAPQCRLNVKDDEWGNLGRNLNTGYSLEKAIERNSSMLEDLLLLALQHDAATNASGNTEKLDQLPSQLKSELRSYVTRISSQYHRVGFHSFEHASHVMLSATKLCYMLKDAATAVSFAPEDKKDPADFLYDDPTKSTSPTKITANSIYDPWLHFAITFAALLHDVDHKGLPNAVLKSHSDPLSIRYGSPVCMSSYAEWNSVDIGLSLLESKEYDLLRGVLLNDASSSGPLQRSSSGRENFMTVVQDLVLCTDIASCQRRELGMSKWEKLFVSPFLNRRRLSGGGGGRMVRRRSSTDTLEVSNTQSAKAKIANNDVDGHDDASSSERIVQIQKSKVGQLQTPEAARVIAEQLMQAADVSHTMQHFETFLKWNQSLYHEILAAHYQSLKESEDKERDTSKRHPAQNWYESQIGFFDGYIIPLAKRLDTCRVFGEGVGGGGNFVQLAVQNKELWILQGKEFTRMMVNNAEGIDLYPPMPLNSAKEDNGSFRPIPNSVFVQEKIVGKEYLHKENNGNDDNDDTDKTDETSIPDSVETSGKVSFVSMASSRSTSSRNPKWGPQPEGEEIDSSVNALVPNMLVRQLIDSLENDCVSAAQNHQMSALREAISKYQSNGSICRHRGALLFVDISGFTNLAQIYPVEDFKTFINRYFTKIIDLIKSFGGEVVKFAGDALYAIWTCRTIEKSNDILESHAINIEKCTACAIAISNECNGYKISKSYSRKSPTQPDTSTRSQGEVLYKFKDKGTEYEERGATLNVYCGVSEGIMAGIDVVSTSRAEFFLIGAPLKDVAQAENLAGPGEAVVSPSVYASLTSRRVVADLSFNELEDGFQRVSWPQHSPISEMSSIHRGLENAPMDEKAQLQIDRLVRSHRQLESLGSDGISDSIRSDTSTSLGSLKPETLQSDIMQLLEYHRHEATRDVRGKFSAELRRVVVIFISILFEPTLPDDPSEDRSILENFQNIYTIITESVVSRSGQVRQFINDDKGTVFIASFGLRGSVTLHPSSTAVEAAIDAQDKLLKIMDIQSSIGVTLGKVFCGETGSPQRYEYSLLGPSCNLSARLMAKGAPGEINCDEEVKLNTGRRQEFTLRGSHKLKGYDKPVPFYMPVEDKGNMVREEKDDITTFFLQNDEVTNVVKSIHGHFNAPVASNTSKPRLLLIQGNEEKGQQPFVSAILNHPLTRSSSMIMEANRCFHDDPFYCFIPIVTRILLSSNEVRERIRKLRLRYKRSSVLGSLLSNDALRAPAYPSETKLVPEHLTPFLSVINDFLYKGFPLIKSTPEAKKLKDRKKVDKCVEVLSALITNFFKLGTKQGIISIPMFYSIDEYSKKLLRHIFASDSSLLIIGGAADSSPLENNESGDGVEAFLRPFIGDTASQQVEVIRLNVFDKKSSVALFSWVLRRDFPNEVEGLIENYEVRDEIMKHCEGMVNVTAELAQTFSTHICKERENGMQFDLPSSLLEFLGSTPNSSEELITFRFDKMNAEEQMLLKIASVAGFDQFSFSQNLLESVLLALSRADHEDRDDMSAIDEGREESLGDIPLSIGGDNVVPTNIVSPNSMNNYEYLFQGSIFEQTLESLVEQKYLVEINVEMSDLASMDSVMYRFRSIHDQSVINGLMLNDQKQRTHFEVALYYQSTHGRESGDIHNPSDSDDVSGSLSTDLSTIPTTNWQLFHITALHYDLADAHLPALIQYYESSAQLASLGMRDGAHGRLLSAYLMLEKMLHDASTLDIVVDEMTEQRQMVASQMVKIIGNKELSDDLQHITKEHLRNIFDGDILTFKTTLSMLTKFGQSVGTIEVEGYKFGSELYLQAILLVLLVLDDIAFANLTSNLDSFLNETNVQEVKHSEIPEDRNAEEFDSDTLGSDLFSHGNFDLDDLVISFPAFSGLLTFYRDSPIGANQIQETFLANLFVAVTQEANEMIHLLRTKCILSHLYLKHGNIEKALEECEGIMDVYNHEAYSLELVATYGMDWCLICIGTMASTYLFRGQFTAAQRCIDFLTKQMQVMDEFASSTKVMSRGTVSSYYLRLYDLDSAYEMSSGIGATQYGYFFKEHGTLQEILARKELALQNNEAFADSDVGFDLLSVLSSDNIHEVQQKRPMSRQSAETLCDRGVEAIQAEICYAEIRNLDCSPPSEEVAGKQLRYCQAGLIYLNQTLSQNDANNHERLKNFLMCLHQKAQLLFWHKKILQRLRDDFVDAQVNDLLGLAGKEMEQLRHCLSECDELSKKYDYPYMQLLVGISYINLNLDEDSAEELIACALDKLTPQDRSIAVELLTEIRP